jgi:hypothetical protein
MTGYQPNLVQAQQSSHQHRQLDCHGGTAWLARLYLDGAIMRLHDALTLDQSYPRGSRDRRH